MAPNSPRAGTITVTFARRAILGCIDVLADQDAKRWETGSDERYSTLKQTPKSDVAVPVCVISMVSLANDTGPFVWNSHSRSSVTR